MLDVFLGERVDDGVDRGVDGGVEFSLCGDE